MNNGVNFALADGSKDLLMRVKATDTQGQAASDVARELVQLLSSHDRGVLKALQADRDSALAAIRVLGMTGRQDALSSLLARLEIPHHDTELLATAVKVGLNGDAELVHQWIVDYDIVGQRLEMIRSVVLPYLIEHCPEKTLFRELKEYEARVLMLNEPLLDPLRLYAAIDAARQGEAGVHVIPATKRLHPESTRIVLPNTIFNTLLRLAWTAQDYVYDLCDRYDPDELVAVLETLGKAVPVYLIPTHLGYPMGGGESFLHQTCRILSEFGIACVWQSFLDPKTGWYTRASRTQTPYYLDVRHAGGCSKEAIQLAIDEFTPDLIHAQGGTSDAAMELATENRLTTMIGYHFWHGLIDLGSTGNKHILENLSEHKLRFGGPAPSRLVHKYVASEFMQEVYSRLGGKDQLQVIHPISDAAQFLAQRDDMGKYVLQVNVCLGKGGEIFFDCLKTLGDDIPFMGVQSEPGDSEFFSELAAEMARRPESVLTSYGNVRDFYRDAKIVIVPTLVDETFCRVAFEAAMNGIPVLCTANGYLPTMLGDTGIFLPEDSEKWIDCIRELYHDDARLRQIGEAQRARLTRMFGSDFSAFIGSAMGLIDHAATRNVGIFTVWGDIGLGNLSHGHARQLRSAGYRVHIFSFQPYGVIGKSLVKQQSPADWSVPENADSVYYSFNHREEVSAYELSQFVLANDIHTLLVPEICWQPNWNRLFEMKVKGLKICSIPMVEIVIREEIPNHNRLRTTLYCTHIAESALTNAGVYNGAFLGYGQGRGISAERIRAKRERLADRPKIRFLHVAGHNPKTRKNTPQVIEAFAKALVLRDDIELTVTSMDPVVSYYPGEIPKGIVVVDRSLARDEILDLYEEHDVSIQVSSHEGLGLGFYESISRGTPVLSLDAPPHNEVVLEAQTGWLIPAKPMAMPDNDRSIVSAWRFDTFALAERIVTLRREEIDHVTASSARIFMERYDEVAQVTRFLQALPRSVVGPAPTLADAAVPVTPATGWEEAVVSPDAVAFQGHEASAEPVASAQPQSEPFSLTVLVKRGMLKVMRRAYRSARPLTRRFGQRMRAITTDATDDLRRQLGAVTDAQNAHSQELFLIGRSLRADIQALAEAQQARDRQLAEVWQEQAEKSRELILIGKNLGREIQTQGEVQRTQHRQLTEAQQAQHRELTETQLAQHRQLTEVQQAFQAHREQYRQLAEVHEASQAEYRQLSEAQQTQYRELADAWQEHGRQTARMATLVEERLASLSAHPTDVSATLALLKREIGFVKDRMASYAGPDTVLTYLRDESPLFVNTGDLGCPSPIVNGGVWEPENLEVLLSFLTSDTVFLDIGANVGYFTVAVGNRLGHGGQVHAFEPHPGLAGLIQRSVHLNSLEPVVKVWQIAVSDQEGTVDLFYPDDHLGRGTASRHIDEPGKQVSVRSYILDRLLPADLSVDLVKIDVEGHELHVLRGMHEVLQRSPGVKILFEKLDANNADNAAIADLLSGLGLSLYGVGPNAVLVPLDPGAYERWVGDVLAARAADVGRLMRSGFSIYPGQLYGTGIQEGELTRYRAQHEGILFFGPDWYLHAGTWTVRFHGRLHGPLRLTIVEEHERMIAELDLDVGVEVASFRLDHPVIHFELRASLGAEGMVDLERIEFERQ
jgi:FkbM family methyltransferase